MAKQFPTLEAAHRDFIARQRIFFVASAAPTPDGLSRVNVSPRPTDCLRVLGDNAVAYLDRTGSGNETAAHARAGGATTVMFCAVEGPPLILRLYGRADVLPAGSDAYAACLADAFDGEEPLGARQIVRIAFDLVQTSCGYGVPLFDYGGERPSMDNWAVQKEAGEGLAAYRARENAVSLDGLDTGLGVEAVEGA